MRGLTLFLMLFVNDLFVPGVPEWLAHTKADEDGMGLADWVFPGFLFMVGMAVPFATEARRKKESDIAIAVHVIIRTLSLLMIGVLMMNSSRINPELTGMNRFLWTVLMYVCVFLIWNHYPVSKKYQKLFFGLKLLGVAGLITLIAIFRSGEPGDPGWLVTGWWGILGLIGWGYFAAAVTYLLAGKRLVGVILVWSGFIALNILSQSGTYPLPKWVHTYLGVLVNGNVPSITVAGLLVALIIRKKSLNAAQVIWILTLLGAGCLAAGFVLRNWFIISKIKATPSWGMICNGISIILFALLYLIVDIMGKSRWAKPFETAGKNSLTTYLAPDIIYYICWGFSIPLFFYKQETSVALAVTGSLVWAFAMIGFSVLLSRIHIRLKL